MAGSHNRALLIGNCGRDPETRNLQSGEKVVNFSLATSETWTKNGERQERTAWHAIVIFNDRTAEVAEKFVRKGSKVMVEGSIQYREWQDKDGNKRTSTEIVIGRFDGRLTLLDSRRDGEAPAAPSQPAPQRQRQAAPAGGGMGASLDDEIPFSPCWQ